VYDVIQMFITMFTTAPLLVHILGQMNPVKALSTWLFI